MPLGRNLVRVLRTWFTDIRRYLVLKKQFMIPYTGAATKHEEQGDSGGSGQIYTRSRHDTAMGLESAMGHKLVQVEVGSSRVLVVVVLVWL